MDSLFIQSGLILTMFFLSGFDKIKDINKVAMSLKDKVKLDIPFNLYYLAIIIVIFLEICGPFTIMYSSITKKYMKESYYYIIGLIIFTILATILYHMPPTGKNYYTFLEHLAILGGLSLLASKFKRSI